ncbi:HupE/UreJ family protein [Coraliomargarita sp. SDUM461003]|uniref:HupE/UreJ family protein n=1 Tax=Thalassobacterium maritimum TaxID=3041265 RepID=A0ABU1ASS6_9BACT|nr:HupE/UreJ family protein [Coraliomargarita sp. SDUM461003]MDQ8206032.1 HupE/UreJ family protein [Coraliomargarita sp. SDUM461003]
MKARPTLFGLLLLLLTTTQALSHQLAVARFQIQEIGPSTYEIRYDVPSGEMDRYSIPILPKGYSYVETPLQHAGPQRLRFNTNGRALANNDTIVLPWPRNGVLASAIWLNGTRSQKFFKASETEIIIELSALSAGSGSALETMHRYTELGLEHILEGYDHLLFVAGLAMLVRGWRRVLLTVSAFTLAHSLTLGLAVLGLIRMPPALVETLIALSIVFLAKEILLAHKGQITWASRWPWAISFGFGLIHGLGFASALMELGLENDSILLALLSFNIGVELGQILFLLIWLLLASALVALGLKRLRYLRPLLPYALGIIAMLWFLERLLGEYPMT